MDVTITVLSVLKIPDGPDVPVGVTSFKCQGAKCDPRDFCGRAKRINYPLKLTMASDSDDPLTFRFTCLQPLCSTITLK